VTVTAMNDVLMFAAWSALCFAGFYAAMQVVFLPVRVCLWDEPTLTAAEFTRANPDQAWVVDWFPFALLPMVPLFIVVFIEIAKTKVWYLAIFLFPLVFFPWLFLPMAGLEIVAGITLLFPARNSGRPMQVIRSPKVRRAGWVRLASTVGLLAVVAGVVVWVRV